MYKILVLSDTHRNLSNTIQLIGRMKDLSHIIHLGDLVSDAEDLESMFSVPVSYVRGNCDFLSAGTMSKQILEIKGNRIFITHGHDYGVKYSDEQLRNLARQERYQVILFGHTHNAFLGYEGDTILMNPGSISLPRNQKLPSFGILEIDDKARIHAALGYFEKE